MSWAASSKNFSAYREVTTVEPLSFQQPRVDAAGNALKDPSGNPVLENVTTRTQTLPMGPIASQEAIKELGTNGGGFLNANSAHPYESPTPLANFIEMLVMVLSPAALT
jgi:potassium-transporting ATPase potassium-binding subunit